MPDLFTMSPRLGTPVHSLYGSTYAINGFHHTPSAAESDLRIRLSHIETPWEWEPRRITWQEREQARFNQGIYVEPIWSGEAWYTDPGHFAHPSLEDPTKIAFTENDAKGDKDIQLRMKPGKYLAKFFPGLTLKQVAFYAAWFVTGERPKDTSLGDVQFASTPEAIVDVYARGPHSCMSKDESVRVYGAGDLAIAYLEKGDKVVARALCWPAKQVFGRVYPNAGNWQHDGFDSYEHSEQTRVQLFNELRQGLKWTHTSEGASLDGARLLKIDGDYGDFVGPYLDHANVVHEDPDQPGFLIHGYPPVATRAKHPYATTYDAQNTGGYFGEEASSDPDWICERCNEGYDEEDPSYSVFDGWTATAGSFGEETWCSHCQENRSFYCEATEETYNANRSSSVTFYDEDGCELSVVLDYAEHNGFICQKYYEFYHDTHRVEMENGGTWSRDAFEEYGFQCSYNSKNYTLLEQSDIWPGWPAEMDSKPFTHAFRRKHAQ